MMAKSRPRWDAGDLSKRSTFSNRPNLEEAVDVPPKDALLALDAVCLVEGTRNGVVLAWKAADDHVDVGDLGLPRLSLVQYPVDVLIHHGALAEALGVASGGELPRLGSWRLPLVRPDGGEGACRLHIELGMVGVCIAL